VGLAPFIADQSKPKLKGNTHGRRPLAPHQRRPNQAVRRPCFNPRVDEGLAGDGGDGYSAESNLAQSRLHTADGEPAKVSKSKRPAKWRNTCAPTGYIPRLSKPSPRGSVRVEGHCRYEARSATGGRWLRRPTGPTCSRSGYLYDLSRSVQRPTSGLGEAFHAPCCLIAAMGMRTW
jgi:hypothetical protein